VWEKVKRALRWTGRSPVAAYILILFVATWNFWKIDETIQDGCARGNLLREGLRAWVNLDISNQKSIDPELFPDIPIETFEALIEERVDQLRMLKHDHFFFVDCETGAPLRDAD
jgi:hypothetical protein